MTSSQDILHPKRVLLVDHPWPDVDIERAIVEAAGLEFLAGPQEAPPEHVVRQMVADFEPNAIMTCWGQVRGEAITAPRDLEIIARIGVGLDNIDVSAATARGTLVTNVPDYCVSEVSDHACALLLACLRDVVLLDRACKRAGWDPSLGDPMRLSELTVGIIGLGRIGQETARKLQVFGFEILASTPHPITIDHVEMVSLEDLQRRSDAVIVHASLNPSTQSLIDYSFLQGCARRPWLVNVSRGEIVDNDGLVRALDEGLLRGAALDTIAGEPSPPRALLERDDVIVTPHTAYRSNASLLELRRRSTEEVVRVLQGQAPHHPCNVPLRDREICLDGGVASDLELHNGPEGPTVKKRALAKLRVSADWVADPARSLVEASALRAIAGLIGQAHVPEVLSVDPDGLSFTMRLIDSRFRNWKRELLAGNVNLDTVAQVATLLGELHARSRLREDLAAAFSDLSHFKTLRIEPFFNKVASRNPKLAGDIDRIVTGMLSRRSALVHGDFSPKNILVDGAQVVILDCEVAHWGDPRFDVAFCLSHLLLKAHRRAANRALLLGAVDQFMSAYGRLAPELLDADLISITGCLMLARIDGDSPVEYRGDLDEPAVRRIAQASITADSAVLWREFALELPNVRS